MAEIKNPPYAARFKAAGETASVESDSGIYPYLHILRNRKGIITSSILLSLAAAFFVNLTQKPVYEASAELVLQSKDSQTNAASSANFFQDPTFLLTQFRMIRSPYLAEKTLDKLQDAKNRDALLNCFAVHASRKRKDIAVFSEKERRALLGAIRRSVSASQVERGARIIVISVAGYNPQMVARLANAAAEAYVEINYQSHVEGFRQSFLMISNNSCYRRDQRIRFKVNIVQQRAFKNRFYRCKTST